MYSFVIYSSFQLVLIFWKVLVTNFLITFSMFRNLFHLPENIADLRFFVAIQAEEYNVSQVFRSYSGLSQVTEFKSNEIF